MKVLFGCDSILSSFSLLCLVSCSVAVYKVKSCFKWDFKVSYFLFKAEVDNIMERQLIIVRHSQVVTH